MTLQAIEFGSPEDSSHLLMIGLKMTVLVYSTLRVWLHWFSAAVILWTLLSGFFVASVDVSAPIKQSVASFNVSLTTVFIPFFVWRLFLFFSHVRCLDWKSILLVDALAPLVHVLIYLIVAIVLVTGVLMMDRPIDVFGVVEFAQPLRDPHLIARYFTVHIWACVVLSLLIALHVGAVIFHEACNHRVLRRMSFFRCNKAAKGQFE
ncbi:cytochrome b/b6 domain-containing protein [Pseudomonas sp. C32]|uniref:cytochrome b/b6 domain-containing protein n=1 Tax=unclassified Pseudomonas TaxID=196821 RepID=UPI00345EC805